MPVSSPVVDGGTERLNGLSPCPLSGEPRRMRAFVIPARSTVASVHSDVFRAGADKALIARGHRRPAGSARAMHLSSDAPNSRKVVGDAKGSEITCTQGLRGVESKFGAVSGVSERKQAKCRGRD